MSVKANRILAKLRHRYAPPEFAFFTEWEVPGAGRRMDGLAVCLYASRGFVVHGFEVKVSRADWVKELGDAGKAEPGFRLCSYWWLVVSSADLVKEGELPEGWGLLVETEQGLRIKTRAKRRKPGTWSTEVFMGLLRRACRLDPTKEEIEGAEARSFQKGRKEGAARAALGGASGEFRDLIRLREKVEAFEKVSGVDIEGSWQEGKRIGEAVKLLLKGGPESVLSQLKWLRQSADMLVDHAKRMKDRADREEKAFKALEKGQRELF